MNDPAESVPATGVRYAPMPGDWTLPVSVLDRILPVGHSRGLDMGRITEKQLRSFAALGALKTPVRVTRTAGGYELSVELRQAARAAFAAAVSDPSAAEGDELVWHTKLGEPRLWADLNALVAKLDEVLPGVDVLLVRREARIPRSRRPMAAQPDGDGDGGEAE